MSIFRRIMDTALGKAPVGAKRSSAWRRVRAAHLKEHPCCAVCGGRVKLEVHHVWPFHLYPHLELEPGNLITLCESKKGGANCHLLFGHLGNYRSFNQEVRGDACRWAMKLLGRPMPLNDKERE